MRVSDCKAGDRCYEVTAHVSSGVTFDGGFFTTHSWTLRSAEVKKAGRRFCMTEECGRKYRAAEDPDVPYLVSKDGKGALFLSDVQADWFLQNVCLPSVPNSPKKEDKLTLKKDPA